ncbi:hypothetical protein ACYATO_08675 [Lactobacillaceae bacterium Melli_B3]
MAIDLVSMDFSHLDMAIPNNPKAIFKDQLPKGEAMLVFCIIHAIVQERYLKGNPPIINLDGVAFSDKVNITKYKLKDLFNQMVHYRLIKVDSIDKDIYQVEIPNFKTWNID